METFNFLVTDYYLIEKYNVFQLYVENKNNLGQTCKRR